MERLLALDDRQFTMCARCPAALVLASCVALVLSCSMAGESVWFQRETCRAKRMSENLCVSLR